MQRIYCTHCTYKTSLIERNSSQSGNAVVGYSVRSSSIDGTKTDEIRKVFRAVERLLSYDLPQDTPSERKAQLSASSAPRKMVFQSKLGENQAVGVISYRTKDTTGRTGSYFADIVVNNLPRTSSESQPTWTPLTAIQCWPFAYDGSANANWWCESEEMTASQGLDGTPLPTPAPDLTKLRGTTPAFLNDQLLWAFLTEETIPNSVDKGRIISPRWSNIPVEQRQELFIRVVQAVIDVATSNKPRVVLAVEPSVASLIYYGIFRLLPEKLDSLSPGFSFTTYESRPERSPYTLTATTFDQVENIKTDLNSHLYSESFCCNTFSKEGGFKYSKAYGDSFKPGAYTEKLHQIIQSQDQVNFYKFIDSLLDRLNLLPNISSRDLDEAVRLFQEIKNYLLEGVPLPPSSRLLNRSLSDRENILAKNCTCFFLTSHDLKQSPSVDFCVNLINWSGMLSAGNRTPTDIREKILDFVPKTSASLRSLLETISPIRLPEDIVFKLVVPITAQDKKIPSGFVRWVKETSKQTDQGKYAEKLLGLLDEDTRSSVSQNALDQFPELLFRVLERESFYRGPDAAKNKSILVECLCAHLKKDNPWELLLAFPRLTTVIQQVEPDGPNAIVKTLSDALTRAEKLQSPPQYLDIQSQRDSRRSLQNLRNWVKLTDNQQSERLIHRYGKLIQKFDEIAEIEDQSFFYKMLSSGVSKRQLQDVLDIIQNLNSSGPPSKTDRPYLQLIEKQFRATGKDIKAFQRAESAIEEYKNRVPARLALPKKKTRRNHKVSSVLVATAILAMVGVTSWLALKNDSLNDKPSKGHAAAAKTLNKQNKNLGKPTKHPPQSEDTNPLSRKTGNPSAANPEKMASNIDPQTRPPVKAKEPASPSTESNPASKGSRVTNPAKKALQADLFACNNIHIKTDVLKNVIVATMTHNTSTKRNMDDFRFLLVAENGKKEKSEVKLDKENKIRLASPSSGGNFSIRYCLKDKQTDSELVTKIFIPPLPANIEIEHKPTEKTVRFEPKFSTAASEDDHQELRFIPPLDIVVVKENRENILREPLDKLRAHNAQLTVLANQYTPEEVTNLKFYCVPKGETIYRPDIALSKSFKPFTTAPIIEQDKVSLKLKPDAELEPVKLLTAPFNAEIDLGLLTPKVLYDGGKDLFIEVEKDRKNIFKGYKDEEELNWHLEVTKERWQKHVTFVPQNNIELSDVFDLLSSKLVVQFKSASNAPKTKCIQLFEPSVKTGNPIFDGKSPQVVRTVRTVRTVPSSFYELWESTKPSNNFFLANLIASIDIMPNNRSVICRAIPTTKSGTQRQLSIIFFGTKAHQKLAQAKLQLRMDNEIRFSALGWSDQQSNKFEDFFHQPGWPNWTQRMITSQIGFSSVTKPPKEKKPTKFWYQYLEKEFKLNTYGGKPRDPKTYLVDIKNALRFYLSNPLKDPDRIEEEIEANQDIKALKQLMDSFEARDDLKRKFEEGFEVKGFTLFWEVGLATNPKPWLIDHYNKQDPNERRVYWSRFKPQEGAAGGGKE